MQGRESYINSVDLHSVSRSPPRDSPDGWPDDIVLSILHRRDRLHWWSVASRVPVFTYPVTEFVILRILAFRFRAC